MGGLLLCWTTEVLQYLALSTSAKECAWTSGAAFLFPINVHIHPNFSGFFVFSLLLKILFNMSLSLQFPDLSQYLSFFPITYGAQSIRVYEVGVTIDQYPKGFLYDVDASISITHCLFLPASLHYRFIFTLLPPRSSVNLECSSFSGQQAGRL